MYIYDVTIAVMEESMQENFYAFLSIGTNCLIAHYLTNDATIQDMSAK